jgi:CheY-like chemotaxis protein
VSRWEGWIAFTVWDTGIGIPEQQQHLIFQKFQQLENPLTRQFEGTGLGLVLTRSLARLHGGDVSFLSTEGKGSSFTCATTTQSPTQESRELKGQEDNISACLSTPISQNQRNCLILIVEAAPRFIENLTEQLTNLGYRFAIARSGTEALEKARRLQPGTIFLNPLLPLLSGWDVLTLLKSDSATSNIPIVITATRAEKDQTFANQADEFLVCQ